MGLVRQVVGRAPRGDVLVGALPAVALGVGVTGATTFVGLVLMDRVSVLVELLVLAAVLAMAWRGTSAQPVAPFPDPAPRWFRGIAWVALAAVALVGAVVWVSESLKEVHGSWDAWDFWNMRGRFLLRAGDAWERAFTELLFWAHPSYPPMLPSNVARGFHLVGRESLLVPAALSCLFTVASPLSLGWTVAKLRGRTQGVIAATTLLAVPYIVKHRLSLPLLLDSLAPGLALGIFVGRIGDLIIGEHLGDATDSPLGWRCTQQYVRDVGWVGPDPFTGPQVQGCFDTAVHQTALYDFLTGLVVLLLILALERRSRFDGFFGMTFGLAYGGGRIITDFARAADKDLIGPFTGTQLTGIGLVTTAIVWLLVTKPWTVTPWAWVPGERAPWTRPEAFAAADAAKKAAEDRQPGHEDHDTDVLVSSTDTTGEDHPTDGDLGERD